PMIEIEGQRVVGVNDSNAHLAAGLAGLGVIQSLRFSARPHIERGELVELLTDWERDPLPMHILYPPNRHLSNKVRVFIDWIAELFEATPWPAAIRHYNGRKRGCPSGSVSLNIAAGRTQSERALGQSCS